MLVQRNSNVNPRTPCSPSKEGVRRIYRAAPIPPRPAVAGCWLLLLALERGLVMDLDIDLGLDLNMGLDLGMDLDMDVDWIWIWV